MKRLLVLISVLPWSLNAAAISVYASNPDEFCDISETGPAYVSVLLPDSCTLPAYGGWVMAKALGWSTSILIDSGFGDFGGGNISVEGHQAWARAVGVTGSGFVNIIYTDRIEIPDLFATNFDAAVGALTASEILDMGPFETELSHSTGFLPITFGKAFSFSLAPATFEFICLQAYIRASITESVTFDIRDANMDPISGAYAEPAHEPVPEPAVATMSGLGLLALAAGLYRRSRPV